MKNKSPIFSFFLIALMAAFNSSVFSQCTSPLTPLDLSASAATNTTRLNCILLDAISTANGNNDVYVTIPNSLKVGTIYPNETYAINQININNSVWPGSSTHTLFITIEPGVTLETPYTSNANTFLFSIANTTNVTILGFGATLSRKSQSILNFKKKNSLLPIKEIQNDLVSIYPNPASGIFKIEYNNKVNENYLLEIYSIEGVKLSAKKIEFTNGKSDWIDCSHLIAGNYYIRIITPKETIVKKINLIK
jgi:hypothetical protein